MIVAKMRKSQPKFRRQNCNQTATNPGKIDNFKNFSVSSHKKQRTGKYAEITELQRKTVFLFPLICGNIPVLKNDLAPDQNSSEQTSEQKISLRSFRKFFSEEIKRDASKKNNSNCEIVGKGINFKTRFQEIKIHKPSFLLHYSKSIYYIISLIYIILTLINNCTVSGREPSGVS